MQSGPWHTISCARIARRQTNVHARRSPRKNPSAPKAAPSRMQTAAKLGALPEWNLTDLYPGIGRPADQARPGRGRCRMRRPSSSDFKGGSPRSRPRAHGGAARRRGASATRRSRNCSAGSSPMPALRLCRQHTDPARAKFYGDVQERITAASLASVVLHARAQPHRRRRARRGDGAIRRSAITGRGSRTCARKSRTSSKTASSSCSTRSR